MVKFKDFDELRSNSRILMNYLCDSMLVFVLRVSITKFDISLQKLLFLYVNKSENCMSRRRSKKSIARCHSSLH